MHQLLINNICRHISLTEEEKAKLPGFFRHKKLRKRQYLLEEGAICNADHFVIKGCLRQYEVDNEGRENIMQFALEDWWIADLYSMLTHTPSVYNIDALEDTEVLVLEYAKQQQLFSKLHSGSFPDPQGVRNAVEQYLKDGTVAPIEAAQGGGCSLQ